MRILQLCPKPPRPARDGGCLAMDAMTQGLLADGHFVRLLAICTEKHPHVPEHLDSDYMRATKYHAVDVKTAVNTTDAVRHLIAGESYHIGRFNSPEFTSELENILRDDVFDVVILESLFMASYEAPIRRLSNARVVLRAHNVEHQIWHGLTQEARMGPKKWYLSKLTSQLKEYEINHLNNFDAVVPISEGDSLIFKDLGATIPMHVSPFGMDFEKRPAASALTSVDHVFHLGSMDWLPNIQGVQWLIEEVWPKVREQNQEATLFLAGRNMPESFKSDASLGIKVIGEVENATAFFTRNGIMTIPLLTGSGMRVKAVEGMSSGRPTVSTEIGVEGLGLVHGEHAFVANSPEEFAKHILLLLESSDTASKIAQSGQAYIRNKFSNKNIISDLVKFLEKLV
ncbi:MAG: glycosyltransferase family 4 protein [Flavobacteriales bacterium]|nr:glycosyltransferase family 4 protein [Flavobacteriales bacterium]